MFKLSHAFSKSTLDHNHGVGIFIAFALDTAQARRREKHDWET